MLIRAAQPDDADAIWSMVEATIATGREFAWRPGSPRDEVMGAWIGEGRHTFIAELDDELAGAYVLKPNQPGLGSHVANGSYVVGPGHRGRGLGRALGEDSIARARALGFAAMQFNLVVADNVAAVALWERLGFERVGTLPGAFELPEGGFIDAYVMFRRLGDERGSVARSAGWLGGSGSR